MFICAFIANAASFTLPISNPANLVIYGSHMPPLLQWLPRYALPSLLSIGSTYAVLRWSQRAALRDGVSAEIDQPDLSISGKMAAFGILVTAAVLLAASGRAGDATHPAAGHRRCLRTRLNTARSPG